MGDYKQAMPKEVVTIVTDYKNPISGLFAFRRSVYGCSHSLYVLQMEEYIQSKSMQQRARHKAANVKTGPRPAKSFGRLTNV